MCPFDGAHLDLRVYKDFHLPAVEQCAVSRIDIGSGSVLGHPERNLAHTEIDAVYLRPYAGEIQVAIGSGRNGVQPGKLVLANRFEISDCAGCRADAGNAAGLRISKPDVPVMYPGERYGGQRSP